mgnify:CR=1 FL=1
MISHRQHEGRRLTLTKKLGLPAKSGLSIGKIYNRPKKSKIKKVITIVPILKIKLQPCELIFIKNNPKNIK